MKTYFIFVVFCGFTILPITLVFRIVGWEWVRWDFWKGTSMIHWPSQDSKLDNVLGYLEWPWLRSRGRKGHQGLNSALYKRADDSSSTHSHMHAWVTVNSGTEHILQTHCVWCMHWRTMNIMNEGITLEFIFVAHLRLRARGLDQQVHHCGCEMTSKLILSDQFSSLVKEDFSSLIE